MSKDRSFSVLIRTKNEERWIGHAIQSIIDFIPKNEIIIIDNNSSDETLSIVSSFKKDPSYNDKDSNYTSISVLNIQEYTPGKAINMGVEKASFENIMIMSSHCVLKKINLTNIEKELIKFDAIFGNQIPIYNGKKIQKRYVWSHFAENQEINMFSEMENRYFFHNAISFFKKDTLIKNKFNEFLTGKEDRYWARDIIEKGGKILYSPEILVDHHYTKNGNTWKGIG